MEKLTLGDFEETIRDFFKENPGRADDIFVRELTKDEIENYRYMLGNFALDGLGDRLFRLPGGAITGIGGVKLFNEALKKEFKK